MQSALISGNEGLIITFPKYEGYAMLYSQYELIGTI